MTARSETLRMAVVCSKCGATGTAACSSKSGSPVSFHAPRWHAVHAAGRCKADYHGGCGIGCESGWEYQCDLDIDHAGMHSYTFVWDDETPP